LESLPFYQLDSESPENKLTANFSIKLVEILLKRGVNKASAKFAVIKWVRVVTRKE